MNEEHVAVVQESGERNWWLYDTPLPEQIIVYPSIEEALQAKPHAALVVTHRILANRRRSILKTGLYIVQKSLLLGSAVIGEHQQMKLKQVIEETLAELSVFIKKC